jgi:hypothetical protein
VNHTFATLTDARFGPPSNADRKSPEFRVAAAYQRMLHKLRDLGESVDRQHEIVRSLVAPDNNESAAQRLLAALRAVRTQLGWAG